MDAVRSGAFAFFLFLLCFFCSFGAANGQAKNRTSRDALWDWSPAKEHHDSVIMIRVGRATGTGVVLYVDKDSEQDDGYLGFCATANHVVDLARKNGEEIRIQFSNATRDISRECSVVRRDRDLDVAVLWTWIPKDVSAARLASRRARPGDAVEFVGLGGKSSLDEGLRHFKAVASAPTESDLIYADQALLPGDSGGPIFDRRGRLLGVISGGWFWWQHEKIKAKYDEPLRATWPARGCNLIPLAKLIARLPGDRNGKCTASPGKRKRRKNEYGEMVAVLPVPRRQLASEVQAEEVVISEPIADWVPAVEGEIIYESSSEPYEIIDGQYFETQEIIE